MMDNQTPAKSIAIASFLEQLEKAKEAQVQTELAMAGIMENEREEELQQLRESLEQKEWEQNTRTAELKLLLSQMKFKSFQIVGWTAVLLALLIVMVLLFSQNYQSCWYLWHDEMGLAFWAKHLLIGCAP